MVSTCKPTSTKNLAASQACQAKSLFNILQCPDPQVQADPASYSSNAGGSPSWPNGNSEFRLTTGSSSKHAVKTGGFSMLRRRRIGGPKARSLRVSLVLGKREDECRWDWEELYSDGLTSFLIVQRMHYGFTAGKMCIPHHCDGM